MRRVPASLALLALRQSGHEIASATLRSWVHRQHITRTADGYDLGEILDYLEGRATAGRDQSREAS
ncbi:hypothetical protein [Actinophytocola sediminis]